MIRFGIIGTGWRTLFFLRIARACPDRFQVTGIVSRTPESKTRLKEEFGVELCGSLDELLKTSPQFVVTSVPWKANPETLRSVVSAGLPVLSETPPGTTVEEMAGLVELARQGGRIQVAEQYHLHPLHAARIAFAQSGKLGTVSQAQVSAAHGYHGLSLIRRILGVSAEPAEISARAFVSPLVSGPNREGPPKEERVSDSRQILAYLDFGGRLGLFDFTGDQYFSHIRAYRLVVRGERGEVVNHEAVVLKDFLTPVRLPFLRQEAGPEGNLEGFHLKGIQVGEEWIYRNPLAPAALPDEEIAIGTCLLKMGEYASGGPAFYPLAEACQDRYLDILIAEAIECGTTVKTEAQPWHDLDLWAR